MTHSLSRRQAIQGGLTTLAASLLLPPATALPVPSPPPPTLQTLPPRGLAAVSAQLSGVGLYVGNDWLDWDDSARRFALAKIRAWGFSFVCPKIGGYARTCYQDTDQLRRWADESQGIGLGFVPFLYTIPETCAGDAQMAAQIARTVGIVCVDMEDEWGAKEKGAVAGYKGAEMAEFGRIYRQEAGALPIVVTGYGDPITRFAAGDAGFPNAEMAAWVDAYSPQWYIGVYSRYKKGGVPLALGWGEDEVKRALGAAVPICPSIDVESSFTPDSKLPLPDILLLMERMRAYNAPVFVWEYGEMTGAYAEALLGPPQVNNIRVGRVRTDVVIVVWDTHVPARSALTSSVLVNGKTKQSRGSSLELTHSEALGGLTPGTAYPVTVQASSGGGDSPAIPLTVATAPKIPGVFVQSAIAQRSPQGHVTVTLLVANSSPVDLTDVSLTTVTVDNGTVLAPTNLPLALGPLAHRDWQASVRDRAELSVIVTGVAASVSTLTLSVSGTATGGTTWASTLPVSWPA